MSLFSLFRPKTLKGIHVDHRKNTENMPFVQMPLPKTVSVSMVQHLGAPCKCTVKKGDRVLVGQVIGEPQSFLCAPIHSGVSGTVKSIELLTPMAGKNCESVVIETDGLQEISPDIAPPAVDSKESFIDAVRSSGLVGLGGAGFPTWIKLNIKPDQKAEYLIINAAECEPYITSDYRLIMESPDDIIAGMKAVQKYIGVEKVIISIESNKPKAIELMQKLAEKEGFFSVHVLPSVYPKGAEKVIIYDTIGRMVPEGKLPIDVGAIVMNVTTTNFLGSYLRTGMPLIRSGLTVDGSAIMNPQNIDVVIGTRISDIAEFCGGYKEPAAKILMGGPMMGVSVCNIDAPVVKNNNAILFLSEEEAAAPKTTACIRCGSCADACPFHLRPLDIEKAMKSKNIEELKALKVNLCMECGCCSYVCPAKRDLVQVNRISKQMLKEAK